MTRARVAAVLFGVAFGFLISWGTPTDPGTIRAMLLFEEAYVILMMGGAGRGGLRGGEAAHPQAAQGPAHRGPGAGPHGSHRAPPHRGQRDVRVGWAIADTCPGPIAAQLGQAMPWALCTAAGVTGRVLLVHARRRKASAVSTRGAAPGGVASGQA
jgi:hypothetical protein